MSDNKHSSYVSLEDESSDIVKEAVLEETEERSISSSPLIS